MLASIAAFFAGFSELSKDIKLLLAYFQKAETAGWFNKSAEVFKSLEQGPTTPEQKDAAAKDISNLIHDL